MRSRYVLVAPLAAAIAISSSWSVPDAAPTHSPGQDLTTLDDQVELSLTVYNSDIALVRDVRRCRCRPATSTSSSWTLPRPSIRRRCTSDR